MSCAKHVVSAFLLLYVLLSSACIGDLVDDSDCDPIVDLREDILTMNPNGPAGSGGECKFAYPGGPNRVEISFYSSLESDRTFEWDLPAGLTDENGVPLAVSVTTDEPVLEFQVSSETPQFTEIGMRIVNPCSQSNWVYDSLEVLDIEVPRLSALPDLPEGRGNAVTAVLDGMIYMLYGVNYDNALSYRYTNYRYDPSTSTWTTLPEPTGPDVGVAKLTEAGSVQIGDDVYMIDDFINVYKHNLRENTLEKVASGSEINRGGSISNQGASIHYSAGKFVVGPINQGLYNLNVETGEWTRKESFRFVDNVIKVDHSLSANNRIYYLVHNGTLVEYNAALGEFRTSNLIVQNFGHSFVINNRIFLQHSINGRPMSVTEELDLQTLELSEFRVVSGNACTGGVGGGNLYMVSTAVIGNDAYLIGGGGVHDINGRGGYGSSKTAVRITLP